MIQSQIVYLESPSVIQMCDRCQEIDPVYNHPADASSCRIMMRVTIFVTNPWMIPVTSQSDVTYLIIGIIASREGGDIACTP